MQENSVHLAVLERLRSGEMQRTALRCATPAALGESIKINSNIEHNTTQSRVGRPKVHPTGNNIE